LHYDGSFFNHYKDWDYLLKKNAEFIWFFQNKLSSLLSINYRPSEKTRRGKFENPYNKGIPPPVEISVGKLFIIHRAIIRLQ